MSEMNWSDHCSSLLTIVQNIKDNPKTILIHARGHGLEKEVYNTLLGLNKEQNYRSLFGDFVISSHAPIELKEEIQLLVDAVMDSLS